MEMKKRISLELKNRSPAEVVELVLGGCRSGDGDLEGLTEDFSSLEVLSLEDVGLKSLSRLPLLPRLRSLQLGCNGLSGGLDLLAERCPQLTHLNLSGNQIQDLSTLQPLRGLQSLRSLDLRDCGVSSGDAYRDAVLQLLPQLRLLDGVRPGGGRGGRRDQDQDQGGRRDQDQDQGGRRDQDQDQDQGGHKDQQDKGDQQDQGGQHESDESDQDEDDEAGPPGDDDEDEEDSEEDSEEEEVGLSYLMKDGIQDEEDDGDYVEEEEDEEEDDCDEDGAQGEKRKREADDDGDDDDDE